MGRIHTHTHKRYIVLFVGVISKLNFACGNDNNDGNDNDDDENFSKHE